MYTPGLIKKLQRIIAQKQDSLKKEVAIEALNNKEDIPLFFRNICQYGCSDGLVGSLIYYADTHAFYDKHYDEIEQLREDYEDNNGVAITIKGDLKNFFARYAFQEAAFQLADELGIAV